MFAERHVVEITTDASGAGVGYTPVLTGAMQTIRYVKDSGADAYANAKYGQFRLGPDGRLLLVAMTDDQLNVIK